MAKPADYVRKKYAPLRDKALKNALAHQIEKQFPRLGGPRIQRLCAEMILEVLARHVRPKDHLTHGQMLWMAVSVDDPPRRHQRIAQTDLVPVVLDVSTCEDIEARLDRRPASARLLQKALRLCQQAYAQGGLLSNCDLAELLSHHDSGIAAVLTHHERKTGTVVPRRATVHDVGTGSTHKRIICLKRYAEGKEPSQIARETYHSLEAVDHYLGQYDRVRCCRLQGLTPQETAHMLDCGLRLVQEYLQIDRDLGGKDA